MSTEASILDSDNWYIGEDRTFDFYCVSGAPVVLSADALSGATTLNVEPLEEALSTGDVLRFIIPRQPPLPTRIIGVTLTDNAAAGATSLTVTAITGHLRANVGAGAGVGYKCLDMSSGYDLEWVLRDRPGGDTAHITKATGGTGIAIGNGLATGDKATITIADADTVDLPPHRYYHTLRRTNAGAEVVLAAGFAVLKEASTR